MRGTGKGLYVKSNPACGRSLDRRGRWVEKSGLIEGVTYEDVMILRPWWWAVWLGPQQQHEPGQRLGGKCALTYPLVATCATQACVTFANLTLRRVFIDSPALSPGVIMGNRSNPMANLTFDGVRVAFAPPPSARGAWPFGRGFLCAHADVRSVGGTHPEPNCSDQRA